ncbi:MAG: pantoate--beta-alanine ligase [Ectothiorhodospiraceae bacterium]|nr:pantoate--beta-alanine ligase [Chromatiales bacterium]MCP5153873.1 pantoate--beta-alanine ligase [Ectothiorhodospiraceae bacterium]
MEVVRGQVEIRARLDAARRAGRSIGLVPTMGNLHAGHAELVRVVRARCDVVVVTIFVNPFQFGQNEDFDTYPRTFDADCALLGGLGTDFVYNPTVADVYPRGLGENTRVEVPGLGDILCGGVRPGFFRGVATVVNILFNIVQPDVAAFGEKDYQQLLVIRRMVEDLAMPIEVVGVPTVREADGLAMSSRNGYLSTDERARASLLNRVLSELRDALRAGDRDVPGLTRVAVDRLGKAGFRPEYVEVRRARDLGSPTGDGEPLIVLGAAWLGAARLIDNVMV